MPFVRTSLRLHQAQLRHDVLELQEQLVHARGVHDGAEEFGFIKPQALTRAPVDLYRAQLCHDGH